MALKSKQKLSEVIQVNPLRQLKKGDLAPFVAMENITQHEKRISEFSQRKVSGSNTKFKNGDTLLAKITPSLENGKTAFVDIFKENEIGHGSTEFIVLCGKENQTLDQFVTSNEISKVDLIKCDVEGAELLILQGSENVIKNVLTIKDIPHKLIGTNKVELLDIYDIV